ncbi:MAG: tetratricopeptide repeat protein [Spirochaeta sp.]|jgi:tetratricopeptide (TPR) repeat protein|nr:tetratricopeptide repeat protein [Spirochaeta sp.]
MITAEKQQVLDFFSEGRKLYKLMEFEQAREFFSKALEVDPNDGPSKVYYARCAHYMENPPPEDWDGVFVMKTK